MDRLIESLVEYSMSTLDGAELLDLAHEATRRVYRSNVQMMLDGNATPPRISGIIEEMRSRLKKIPRFTVLCDLPDAAFYTTVVEQLHSGYIEIAAR